MYQGLRGGQTWVRITWELDKEVGRARRSKPPQLSFTQLIEAFFAAW